MVAAAFVAASLAGYGLRNYSGGGETQVYADRKPLPSATLDPYGAAELAPDTPPSLSPSASRTTRPSAPSTGTTGSATARANGRPAPVPAVLPGASYALSNDKSGLALDVGLASIADGAVVIQFAYHGGDNQKWRFTQVGSGWYEVVNVNSGKALELPNTAQGSQLDQRTYIGATTQQWQLGTAPGGVHTLVNRATGFLTDVGGASTAEGTAVIGWPADGGASQWWHLQLVS
jgi:hypothetical protein